MHLDVTLQKRSSGYLVRTVNLLNNSENEFFYVCFF